MPSKNEKREEVCIVTPDFPVVGGMRSVLRVLLSQLVKVSDPIVLARNWGDAGYLQYDLSFSRRVRGLFNPWYFLTLPFFELSGLLWCFFLRVRGVRKFLVQEALLSGFFASVICKLTGAQLYLFDYGAIVNLETGLLEKELNQSQPPRQTKFQLKLMRRIRWLSLRSSRLFFVHSPATWALALRTGVSASRIVEYGFPLDASLYQKDVETRERVRKELRLEPCFCVLYAGRMTLDKGLPSLIEAISSLTERHPGKLHLLLVGSGPMEPSLKRMAARLGLENVSFLGAINDPRKVAALMSAADVFVYPIVFSGGVAMAVLEAMSCELPVIVGAAGPTKDLIVEGKNGFVVRNDGAEPIIEAIDCLLGHPRTKSLVGKRARETVVKGFGIEQYSEAVVDRIVGSG